MKRRGLRREGTVLGHSRFEWSSLYTPGGSEGILLLPQWQVTRNWREVLFSTYAVNTVSNHGLMVEEMEEVRTSISGIPQRLHRVLVSSTFVNQSGSQS